MSRIDIGGATMYLGDCLEVLPTLAANSVEAIVTDPPYGLGFMGKAWDHGVPGVEFWTEALRVAKPGAWLAAFGGTRTFHRMMCAIEDAGWEIRDTVMWLYGSGFPKSKNLDGEWQGWGTALKPAWEPIIMARKPLVGTVAANVLTYGTGALNIDGCRVEGPKGECTRGAGGKNGRYHPIGAQGFIADDGRGRWPANVIHDGSEEVLAGFPESVSRDGATKGAGTQTVHCYGRFDPAHVRTSFYRRDAGSAARFFYCAKASKSDRGEGNNHPTVKPTALMAYLCRLVTPPGGTVLDPFAGSGSTGKAAVLEGFGFAGIEREAEYVEIACRRIEDAQRQGRLVG